MRKQLLFIIAGIVCMQIVTAQSKQLFKPFKFDIGIGTSPGANHGTSVIGYLEPSYTFLGKFKVGARLEGASLYMKSTGFAGGTVDYYYLGQKRDFHPYIGGGLGSYTVGESGGCDGGPTTTTTVRSTKPFGSMLRTGFEVNHFHFEIEYNFIANTYVSDIDGNGKSLATMSYKNAYLGLTMGVYFGGGMKKVTRLKK